MKNKTNIILILCIVGAVYYQVATFVFKMRHPWATQTELVYYHFFDIVTFNKLTYNDTRQEYINDK